MASTRSKPRMDRKSAGGAPEWRCGMECDGVYTREAEDGQEIGGRCAGMALRNFGRFAQFVLEDGVADGQRILPAGWVDAANSMAFRFTGQNKDESPKLRSGGLE